jgi:anti-anti-sigma regulatory factor
MHALVDDVTIDPSAHGTTHRGRHDAVTYCDSAAIGALFAAAGKARLTIQVGTPGPITDTLLKVSGLDQVATVVTLD